MRCICLAVLAAIITLASPAAAVEATVFAPERPSLVDQLQSYQVAARRGCKAVSTCRDAVEMWCSGYAGTDRDKDGIPCENVCKSRGQNSAGRSAGFFRPRSS